MQDPVSRIGALATALDTLDAAGVTPSPEWAQLAGRWQAFRALDSSAALDTLADAVASGDVDPERLALLAAGASLTASPMALAELHQGVARRLLPRFEAVAVEHGRKSHADLVKRFNVAAHRLAGAVKVSATIPTAEAAIRGTDDQRAAYLERAELGPALDMLAAALLAAAQLAGEYRPNPDAAASLWVNFTKVSAKLNRTVWDALVPGRVDWAKLADLDVIGARPLGVPVEPRHPGCEARLVRGGVGYGQRLWDPVAQEYVN